MASALTTLFLVVTWLCLTSATNGRCRRAIRTCYIGGNHVEYDDCLQFCCGAGLHDRDVYSACCGDERAGVPYNSRTQICCAWAFGGEFVIYDKGNNTNAVCCGSELFPPRRRRALSCCLSYTNRPQIFNSLRAMCCQGVVTPVVSTAFTSCCGDRPYNRRFASCPCDDDVIAIGVPDRYARCCYGPENTRIPYNLRSQGCCNGVLFDLSTEFCCGKAIGISQTQFCCGDVIGDTATQICCGVNTIASLIPQINGSEIGCCLLIDGVTLTYNVRTSICCGDGIGSKLTNVCCGNILTSITPDLIGTDIGCCIPNVGRPIPYNTATGLCCGNNVIDLDLSVGNACCVDVVYSTRTSVCCGGSIFEGNRCCNGDGYYNYQAICCAGYVRNHTAIVPACCDVFAYDADRQTCCGANVYNNPLVVNGQGDLVISRHTRCCGNVVNPNTLRPYDYLTQTCCANTIVDLNGIPWDVAGCCGVEAMNLNQHLCCDGTRVDLEYGSNTVCCGSIAIDSSNTICCNDAAFPRAGNSACCTELAWDFGCCEGIVVVDLDQYSCCAGTRVENIFGIATQCCGTVAIDSTTTLCCDGVEHVRSEDAVCCGISTINPNEELCCDGVPRSLNGVPRENAICCGDGCIDGSLYWCCDGKQYQKGVTGGADVSGLDCTDLFTGK